MSAPANAKESTSPATNSKGVGGFYLKPKTKVSLLAICLTLMIGASTYAVLQPLNPDPVENTFWHPYETNPYARLQGVSCANDYACRLNSVAITGSGELPEVWAVGNVGLVLHRKAGQKKWEQLKISATEEQAAKPTPPPNPRPTPRTTPTSNITPIPALRDVPVPSLIGLTLNAARKMAFASGFDLDIEYEDGFSQAQQQGPPPDVRVINQSPSPKTLAPANSTIKINVGKKLPSEASWLLDRLIPAVYAAEPEKPSKQQAAHAPHSDERNFALSGTATGESQPQFDLAFPLTNDPLNDDLIYVDCQDNVCQSFGRSGRIYKMNGTREWRFVQASFVDHLHRQMGRLTLLYEYTTPLDFTTHEVDAGVVFIAKSGSTILDCFGGMKLGEIPDPPPQHICGSVPRTSEFVATEDNQVINETIQSRYPSSSTTASLRSSSFSAISHTSFIVGDYGTILSRRDGDKSWRHETQGPEGSGPNHRIPGSWYWTLAVVLVVACLAVVAIPAPPPSTEFSVADWTVTDAPLKPGDVDSLGFTPMALGLSRFIRNPKTQPPVTLAVEGEWGEGKSSIMSLLCADLEKSRFRPVWFNAWHHQSEEQLLAALLEHIKHQAVPPWWHIDNWIFRARLLRFRFHAKWPLAIILVLALCGSIAFEISRHGLKLNDFGDFGKDTIKLIQYLLPWSKQNKPPGDLTHFGLAATLIAILATVIKNARAFGINTSKLTDNLRDATTIKNIKPDPGIRPRFAREFGDFCKAWFWGGRRVIIFIDDLDRCRPESVVTVLESINFLTTAADCIIVLGMAQKQVTHAVGLGFEAIAHAEEAYRGGGNTEQEKAIARFNYGALYIKKLVNIVAPLPKTTPEQRHRVLEVRAAEARRQDAEENAAKAPAWRLRLWETLIQSGRLSVKIAPVLGLVLAVLFSALIGYRQGVPLKSAGEQPTFLPSIPKQDSVGSVAKTTKSSNDARMPLAYERPTTQPATLIDSTSATTGARWSYAADALFLFGLFGILGYQLSARTNLDAQNSPDFEKSLQLWGRYIVGVCDTPREIKRALNDLRYQAMTRRTNGPSSTRGERLLRTIRQLVTGQAVKHPVETHVDESALPPLKAAALAALTDQELRYFFDPDNFEIKGSENLQRLIELKREHLRLFHRWINAVNLGQASSVAPEIDNVAARAARHA